MIANEISMILGDCWSVLSVSPDMALYFDTKSLDFVPQSILIAAFPYLLPEEYYRDRNISRYAVVQDYHSVIGKKLEETVQILRMHFPQNEFRCYCDNSPIREVALAERAGLGVRGKHNVLITKLYGSWVFLGEIVCAKPLAVAHFVEPFVHPCENCHASCRTVCPSAALSDTGLNREICVSALSQKKGTLSPGDAALLRQAGSAWGCDCCQEACAYNKTVQPAAIAEFWDATIAVLTEENLSFPNRAYTWRGQAVPRRNLSLLQSE
jgi:epoxyqueuosine reductase QueG